MAAEAPVIKFHIPSIWKKDKRSISQLTEVLNMMLLLTFHWLLSHMTISVSKGSWEMSLLARNIDAPIM